MKGGRAKRKKEEKKPLTKLKVRKEPVKSEREI